MPNWLQSWIQSNRLKSLILVFLFPVILTLVIFLAFLFSGNVKTSNEALYETWKVLLIVIPALLIWLCIAFYYEKELVFSFSWAKEATRKEYPEVYNIVENLCISCWLHTPKIWIIDDESMNAFALWWESKNSRICFTTWLIKNLNKKEIEAVTWHELTHIINKDCLLMLVAVLYIWAIWTIWQRIINLNYSDNDPNSKRSWNFYLLIWWGLLILWYLFYPLIRLAISRKREFLADAWSVILTKDNQSMISALKKISKNPNVPIKDKSIASIFIENPLKNISTLFQTHPSIEDRIKALESY